VAKRRDTRGPLPVVNRLLEDFLIALAVDDALRDRFINADEAGRKAILAEEFGIGEGTITALLTNEAERVTARLRISDQQGFDSGPSVKSKQKKPKKSRGR
jgi:hypothetical protein